MLINMAHHVGEGSKRSIVRLGDVDIESLVNPDEEVQPVHRVEIHLDREPYPTDVTVPGPLWLANRSAVYR